jgi:hypothetical protein
LTLFGTSTDFKWTSEKDFDLIDSIETQLKFKASSEIISTFLIDTGIKF